MTSLENNLCVQNKRQMDKCRLSFKSFQYIYIEKSIQRIRRLLTFWQIAANQLQRNNSPTLRKKYTLLSSPHIHKKSREQFEWVRKKGEIIVQFHQRRHLLLLLFFLQKTQFPGVELKITLYSSTTLPSKKAALISYLAKT